VRPASLALLVLLVAPAALAQANKPYTPGPTQPYTPGGTAQPYNPGGTAPATGTAQPYTPPGANPQGSRTEQSLKKSEELDSGRGLEWFYVGAEGGVFWLGADALSKSGGPLLTGDKKVSGVGGGGGLFLGGRVYVLTAGARVRTAWVPGGQFLTVGPEVALHIPMGNLEPHVGLGAGYAALLGNSEKVSGFTVGLDGGLDYYISNHFSAGAQASFGLVSLSRGAYQDSPKGSALGLTVAGTAVLGLHF